MKPKLITTFYDRANLQTALAMLVIAMAIILIAAAVSVLNALYSKSSH